LRNREQAEDAVQETFLAALTNVGKFSGNSTKKTWLTGILNHKVCDQLRNTCRNRVLFRNLSMDDHRETDAATFATVGFTLPPRDPRTELESKELREALNAALQKLPPREARVISFTSRDFGAGAKSARRCKFQTGTCGLSCTGLENISGSLFRNGDPLTLSEASVSGTQSEKAWKPIASFAGEASRPRLVPVVEFYAQNIED